MKSKFRTYDRETEALRFFTVEQLGEKQSLTPEGFLVIQSVPIARTGVMIYGPNEVPLPAGPDGVIRVIRDESEVFRPEYIASYEGKPIVNDHPYTDVTPENWKQFAVGTVLNPRRGSGVQMDLLIADFIVTDMAAIKDIRDGKREVSCGYDADYEEVKPGEGRQTNMIGNHVALVDAGRCGPRCAIGDRKSVNFDKGDEMGKKPSKALDGLIRRLKDAFKAKDEQGFEQALEAIPDEMGPAEGGDHMHVHLHQGEKSTESEDTKVSDDDQLQAFMAKNDADHAEFRQRLEALEAMFKAKQAEGASAEDDNKEIEGQLAEEAPAGTADKARKAKDSMYLEESFQETVAAAEILVPGIRIPTFDRAADPKESLDSICKLRRTALDLAYHQPADRGLIDELNGKPLQLEEMSCAAVRQLFRTTVTAKKTANSNKARDVGIKTDARSNKPVIRTQADLNKLYAEMYKTSN